MKNKGFKSYYTASRYIRRKYAAEGRVAGFGSVSVKITFNLKKRLVNDHSLEELSSLKSALSSQLEFLKQFNLVITVVTFVIATIFNPLIFYLQQHMKVIDWTHNAKVMILSEKLKFISKLEEKEKLIAEDLLSEVKSYQDEVLNLQHQHTTLLLRFFIYMIPIFVLFLMRYKWLSDISACVTEAYEEKKRLDDSEKKRLEQFEKLISIASIPNKVGIHDKR